MCTSRTPAHERSRFRFHTLQLLRRIKKSIYFNPPTPFPLFTESIAYLLTFILWWFLFCLFESAATELGPVSVGRQAALPDRYCGRAVCLGAYK